MAGAVMETRPELFNEEQLAAVYATTLVYKALIEAGEPLKASEVYRAIGRPDVDLKLTRVVLATNPQKMTASASTNRWTLWTRFLDTRNTFDTNLKTIFTSFGQPIHRQHLAQELGAVYRRPPEVYEAILQRFAAEGTRYRRLSNDYIVPTQWLLDTDPPYLAPDESLEVEVQYENFLSDADILLDADGRYAPEVEAAELSAENPESIAAFLDAVGQPVKSKALQFLAWRRQPETFDPLAFYEAAFLHSGAFLLGDGTWIGPALAQRLAAHFPAMAEQEVSEFAEAEAQEAAQPLALDDSMREELVETILNSDQTVFATRLLEDVFEITPDYRTYQEDLQTIIRALAADDRVLWLGADRFRAQGTLPAYVFSVPGLLEIPTYQFTDVEGNQVDQLLEDDGFDGGLERDILSPMAQDVLDEEPVPLPDPNPPSNARAVIKYHHKQIGTLPLCQFPSGFFPSEPTILETEFLLPGGHRAQVWINNETRLLYGLLDWFQTIPIDSGATFTLERQAPDRYLVNYNDESEPAMFISRNRINELLDLQARAEAEEIPTFDIIREIMEHYRKGIEFLTLHTEVNIARRVTRRLVASILSEYHCFFQRGGAWVYDAKKLSQGFDKSKRKYLVK